MNGQDRRQVMGNHLEAIIFLQKVQIYSTLWIGGILIIQNLRRNKN